MVSSSLWRAVMGCVAGACRCPVWLAALVVMPRGDDGPVEGRLLSVDGRPVERTQLGLFFPSLVLLFRDIVKA